MAEAEAEAEASTESDALESPISTPPPPGTGELVGAATTPDVEPDWAEETALAVVEATLEPVADAEVPATAEVETTAEVLA